MTTTFSVASAFLASIDAHWARLVEQVGPCTHEPKPAREPYEALIRAIAYQQLHARAGAGDAILGRMLALYPGVAFPSAEQIVVTPPETLRACGFSASKLATIQGIAQAAISGLVPSYAEAAGLDDEDLIERLITLRGVGRWTVEMFLIYTLERMDILPADDFGVREGYRRFKGLETQLTRKQMIETAKPWSPWRTVAAWYLWRAPALK